MSEQIEAGDGWRLLAAGEIIKRGDEFWDDTEPALSQWIDAGTFLEGQRVSGIATYRRRIPAKPESISMMDYSGIIAVTGLPETVTIEQVFYGEESDFVVIETVQNARQLAEWLTRYADWREAQKN
jgi:hypothetical protein